MAYKQPKPFKAPRRVGDSNAARKRHSVGSSTNAARLGSLAHKATHAAGKVKRYK